MNKNRKSILKNILVIFICIVILSCICLAIWGIGQSMKYYEIILYDGRTIIAEKYTSDGDYIIVKTKGKEQLIEKSNIKEILVKEKR